MNDTSMVTTSTGYGTTSAVSARALTPSRTMTRESVRSRQSSWLCPTSSAMTDSAPRCSSTSVNPPVDAPISSARSVPDVEAEHVERMRELDAAAADVGMVGRAEHDLRVGRDRRTGLGHDLAIDPDVTGEDQRARPLA